MDHLLRELRLALPSWFDEMSMPLTFKPNEVEQAMALAIELSRQNVTHQTGGPFGALVVSLERGEIISAAVNCVEAQSCSSAHAEVMALSLAQKTTHVLEFGAKPSRAFDFDHFS